MNNFYNNRWHIGQIPSFNLISKNGLTFLVTGNNFPGLLGDLEKKSPNSTSIDVPTSFECDIIDIIILLLLEKKIDWVIYLVKYWTNDQKWDELTSVINYMQLQENEVYKAVQRLHTQLPQLLEKMKQEMNLIKKN